VKTSSKNTNPASQKERGFCYPTGKDFLTIYDNNRQAQVISLSVAHDQSKAKTMNNTIQSNPGKSYRIASIIETPNGILTALDLKCKFREKTFNDLEVKRQQFLAEGKIQRALGVSRGQEIVKKGRYSLPGGGMERKDFAKAGAEELIGKRPKSEEEIRAFIKVATNTVIRENEEELGLETKLDSIQPIMEILGRTRNHIIFLVSVKGKITLQEDELCGIGFLSENSPIKLKHHFFQAHALVTAARYLRDPGINRMRLGYLSGGLEFPKQLINEWYENSISGYESRAQATRQKQEPPVRAVSGPNFRIL